MSPTVPTLRCAQIADGIAAIGAVAERVEWNFPSTPPAWARLCGPGEAGLGGTTAARRESHTAVASRGRGWQTPALPRGAVEPGRAGQLEFGAAA